MREIIERSYAVKWRVSQRWGYPQRADETFDTLNEALEAARERLLDEDANYWSAEITRVEELL